MVSIMCFIRGLQMNGRTGLLLMLVLDTAVLASAGRSGEPLPGIVEVPADVNAVVCNNIDERFIINGAKGPAGLPVGTYHIENWNIERIDENGNIWKLRAERIPVKTFNVKENSRTVLPVGEPVVCALTVRKEDSEFYFRHYLKGRLGEELELTKNQSRPDPPKLLICDKSGSYQESLVFKYG
jgi:hypothetical protein